MVLVRDHTLQFVTSSKFEVDEFNDVIQSTFSEVRCVQAKEGGIFEVTFCTVEMAKKVAEKFSFRFNKKDFFAHPVDKPRTIVKIKGLPFEIQQAEIAEVLENYGTVIIAKRDKYPNRPFDNGDRTFVMDLDSNIPRYITVQGYEAVVYHRKQEQSCTYCKKQGHVRRHCPDLVCHVCSENGHFSYECPKRFCKACKKYGHSTRQCPDKISTVPEKVTPAQQIQVLEETKPEMEREKEKEKVIVPDTEKKQERKQERKREKKQEEHEQQPPKKSFARTLASKIVPPSEKMELAFQTLKDDDLMHHPK